MILKRIHLFSGILILLLFAITGHYMKYILKLPSGEFTAQRMMYRASHLYLLFAGSINVVVGCYWSKISSKYLRHLQSLGSLLLIFAQVFLFIAFMTEPDVTSMDRKLTLYGCASVLLGVIFTLSATSLTASGWFSKNAT